MSTNANLPTNENLIKPDAIFLLRPIKRFSFVFFSIFEINLSCSSISINF